MNDLIKNDNMSDFISHALVEVEKALKTDSKEQISAVLKLQKIIKAVQASDTKNLRKIAKIVVNNNLLCGKEYRNLSNQHKNQLLSKIKRNGRLNKEYNQIIQLESAEKTSVEKEIKL